MKISISLFSFFFGHLVREVGLRENRVSFVAPYNPIFGVLWLLRGLTLRFNLVYHLLSFFLLYSQDDGSLLLRFVLVTFMFTPDARNIFLFPTHRTPTLEEAGWKGTEEAQCYDVPLPVSPLPPFDT